MRDGRTLPRVFFCSLVSDSVPGSHHRHRRLGAELAKGEFCEVTSGGFADFSAPDCSRCDLGVVLCADVTLEDLLKAIRAAKIARIPLVLVASTRCTLAGDVKNLAQESDGGIQFFAAVAELVDIVRRQIGTLVAGRCNPTGLLFEEQAA